MKLYTNAKSRGQVISQLLRLLDVEYEEVSISFGKEMKSNEFLKLNPMGKIPVLVDGETVIYETGAICIYLCDKFPLKDMAPQIGSPNRGEYLRWMFFGAGPLDFSINLKRLKLDSENKGFLGYSSLENIIDIIVSHLKRTPYFLGQELSVVDLYIGTLLKWGSIDGAIPKNEILSSYISSIDEALKL